MILRAPIYLMQLTRAVKTRCVLCKKDYLVKKDFTNVIKQNISTPSRTSSQNILLSKSIQISSLLLAASSLKSLIYKKSLCEPEQSKEIMKHDEQFNWKKLLFFIYLDIWQWLGAIAAALCVAYINIQLPICLGQLANIITNLTNASTSHAIGELNFPAVKLVILYFAQALGTLFYISLLSSAGEKLAQRLKNNLFEAIVNQDIAFFDTTRTGELVDCLFADIQEFKSSFKQCVSQGLRNTLQICGCVISLFNISPKMTLSVLTIVPVVIITGSLFGMALRKISKAAQEQSGKVFTMCEEVLSNIRTVRYFSNESLECQKLNKELEKTCHLNSVLGFGIGLFQAGTNLFLNGLILGILFIGSHYMISDNLTPGSLMSFLVTAQMIQKSFAQLSLTFGHFLKGKQSFQRIAYFINLKPTIPTAGGIKIPYHSFVPNVEFQNVSFAYPTRPSQIILHNLNLVLPAGRTVAVVGASGNGKSTIALLLQRFYDVNHGSIRVNDIDIREIDPHWLRSTAIGIINQEPVLFATSIKENIKYGKPDATDEEVYEAAKQANADSFIQSFPDKYETIAGERGVALSGGQKQRIAIARALIKKPSILILDEATSALDTESEKVVQETLEKACKGRTVLIIAHRLSTIRNADVIAVLNKGIILEMGSHEDLMKLKGAYYRMVNQQKGPRKTG